MQFNYLKLKWNTIILIYWIEHAKFIWKTNGLDHKNKPKGLLLSRFCKIIFSQRLNKLDRLNLIKQKRPTGCPALYTWVKLWWPSGRETLTLCRYGVSPPPATLTQHQTHTASASRVCWEREGFSAAYILLLLMGWDSNGIYNYYIL